MFSNIQKKDYKVVDLIRQREIQVSYMKLLIIKYYKFNCINKFLIILTVIISY